MKSITHYLMVAAAALCGFAINPAQALIIGDVLTNPDGSFTYMYAIAPQGRLVTNWGLDLVLPKADWDLNSVQTAGGWIADWSVATGNPDLDFIEITGSGAGPDFLVTGFYFTSWFSPGAVNFSEFGVLGDGSGQEYGSQGSVVGPVSGGLAVPDTQPGWLPWLTVALVVVGGSRWSGSRRDFTTTGQA